MDEITLEKCELADAAKILALSVEIFTPFLEKYHDDAVNPAKMPIDKVVSWLTQDFTTIYFVKANDEIVGFVRVIEVTWDFPGQLKIHLSPLGIVPSRQNQGIMQEVFRQLEQLYQPTDGWELSTILQEARNIHFYEKLGYERTGEATRVNEFEDIVGFYKK